MKSATVRRQKQLKNKLTWRGVKGELLRHNSSDNNAEDNDEEQESNDELIPPGVDARNPGTAREAGSPTPIVCVDFDSWLYLKDPFLETKAGFSIPEGLKILYKQAPPTAKTISTFYVSMGIWATLHPLSGQTYRGLWEALQLVDDISLLRSLPKSLSTLQEQLTRCFPIPTIFRKEIPLDRSKLLNMNGKDGKGTIYMLDEREVIKNTLEDRCIRLKLHLGLGHIVDQKAQL